VNDQNQQWVYGSDHSFKNVANGGCIDLWNSGTGPAVGVYTCDGGVNQHWEIDVSDSMILSDATNPTGRCMTSGVIVSIWVYTNLPTVQLWVNGVSQGAQALPNLGHVQWDVSYSPGNISAQGFDSTGAMKASQTIQTTGPPAAIRLLREYPQSSLMADGQDVALITVFAYDAAGRYVPDASNNITFTVSGPGRVFGVGNGDPSCHEPDKASYRSLFNGLARVIVQATTQAGAILLSASSPGLSSASITIQSNS